MIRLSTSLYPKALYYCHKIHTTVKKEINGTGTGHSLQKSLLACSDRDCAGTDHHEEFLISDTHLGFCHSFLWQRDSMWFFYHEATRISPGEEH